MEVVYVRSAVNRRVHKRHIADGRLTAITGCALDTTDALVVLTRSELQDVSVGDLCWRCFGELTDLMGEMA